ncbi:MAG: DNA methyltransferase [Geitlerinemataceae cyanobacterium]
MPFNLTKTRQLLQTFQFEDLFVEQLGWSAPGGRQKAIPIQVDDEKFTYRQVAELCDVRVFTIVAESGEIPKRNVCEAVYREISQFHLENLLIFLDGTTDETHARSLWYWVKREGTRIHPRNHVYIKREPCDLLLSKISALRVDLTEQESISTLDVAQRLQQGFDVERVTKQFFEEFKQQHQLLTDSTLGIQGIETEVEKRWYASVILNRLMFVYFLQRKGFLDGGKLLYLQEKLQESQQRGTDLFYRQFLPALFFEGFGRREEERQAETRQFIGNIKYLNGGLFLKHPIEEKYPQLLVPDAPLCSHLLEEVLPNLTLLDPACGSGAFLVAAMKTLIYIYSAVVASIKFITDHQLNAWLKQIEAEHPSLQYYIKKRIITDNLYGVDLMEEATEIAKLRLFLALVSAAHEVNELEPLPNIDFNIMAGNSLIGLIRVDAERFDGINQDLLQILAANRYQEILEEKNTSIQQYKKHAFLPGEQQGTSQENRLLMLRQHIETLNRESQGKLNQLLLEEFSTKLGIKYEEVQLTGKAKKRVLKMEDMAALKPFHWGYHFDAVLERGGFDAIITNPPWETFKPQGKEFFAKHNELVTKNKMDIKAFEKEKKKLLEKPEVVQAWLEYQSQFPHVSAYYRTAEQYPNQISVVNGKKAGTDINLYKLFLEQCFNLLRPDGECGIVVPSGIYTDLGAKQLRELLFGQTEITSLFCLENRKLIFEGVHRSFKIVVLTFKKGGVTLEFPSAFMRLDVDELKGFPNQNSLRIQVDLIRKLSPDSLSVMEFKRELDIQIAEKMLQFPLLGEEREGTWNLRLTSEFNMTTDSHLFEQESGEGKLPPYEGKMIHQFTHQYAEPRYWVDAGEGRKAVLRRKGIDSGQILDYQRYRLAFRDVARNTDIRTMIATIVPPNVFAGNTLVLSQSPEQVTELLFIGAIFNSFTCYFMVRQKVTANCNMFYIYQLPVPRLTATDPTFPEIVHRAAKLICTTPEFDDLAAAVGIGSHHNGIPSENERTELRAELDGIIAHLYGLTEAEFSYILSTFPLVPDTVKQATLAAYGRLSNK